MIIIILILIMMIIITITIIITIMTFIIYSVIPNISKSSSRHADIARTALPARRLSCVRVHAVEQQRLPEARGSIGFRV